MTRAAAVALVLLLSGCAALATPQGAGLAGAALGFGAAALDLDTELLRMWDERHPVAPPPEPPNR